MTYYRTFQGPDDQQEEYDAIRNNSEVFSGQSTARIPQWADSAYFRLDPRLAGETLYLLPDVVNVSFANVNSVVPEASVSHVSILQRAYNFTTEEDFLHSYEASFMEHSDEILVNSYNSVTPVNFWSASIFLPPARIENEGEFAQTEYFDEYYIQVIAHNPEDDFASIYGTVGLTDLPSDGRFLLATGNPTGQRSEAWGGWIETLNATVGPGSGPAPEPVPEPEPPPDENTPLKQALDTYFVESEYLAANPDVAAAVAAGVMTAEDHYILYGQYEDRESTAPDTTFDETVYLAENPDVAAAVSSGLFTNGHQHFTMYGSREGRTHSEATLNFDAEEYTELYSDIKFAWESGAVQDVRGHFIEYGIVENRSYSTEDFLTDQAFQFVDRESNFQWSLDAARDGARLFVDRQIETGRQQYMELLEDLQPPNMRPLPLEQLEGLHDVQKNFIERTFDKIEEAWNGNPQVLDDFWSNDARQHAEDLWGLL